MNNQILNPLTTISKSKKGLSVALLVTGILSTMLIPQNTYAHGVVKNLEVEQLYVVQTMEHLM